MFKKLPISHADFRSSHLTIEFQTATGIRYYTVVDVIRTDIYDEIYNNISSEVPVPTLVVPLGFSVTEEESFLTVDSTADDCLD